MGSNKEEEDDQAHIQRNPENGSMSCLLTYLLSFLASTVGGLLIGWWAYKYHPQNRQLWMVPFGLVLLVTPVVVWFSVFITDLIGSENDEHQVTEVTQRVRPVHSYCDDILGDPVK